MSTSTVSVTANPRRRLSSSVAAVKQSINILDAATTAAVKSTELSHSKETSSTSATAEGKKTSSRGRKHVKPRWKRLVSVVLKNLVLVFVVAGLVQFVWKWDSKEDGGFSDMEVRIKAVEMSMKTTSKMVEVQLDVVEKKIDAEIGNLRGEIGSRVEGETVEFEEKLKELHTENELIEAELGEFREVLKRFVTKEDVIKIYEQLRSGKLEGNVVSLDEIRKLAREIVEKEIEKHSADGLGRVDYAVASGGARVVKHSEALMVESGFWLGGTKQRVHESAIRMLSSSFGEPGMCFALKGSTGFVQIRLRTAIVPEAVTLEHVAKSVAFDQTSAPKNCRVFGWLQGQQGLDTDLNGGNEEVLLTEFTYDLEKSNAQTYNLVGLAATAIIDTVRFEFSSNHGSLTHTCIYRLRVHGHDSVPVSKIA